MAKKIDKPDGKETMKHEKNEKIRGKAEQKKEKLDTSINNFVKNGMGKKCKECGKQMGACSC